MSYTGNSSYCYSNSLHMCLQHAGMPNLPNVGFIECATGMPFGTTFLDFERPLFFPNPAATDPHQGLSQALQTLGWTNEMWQGDDATAATAYLRNALKDGPVLLGPLDMSHLLYDPNHATKTGGDHFIVALSSDGDMVTLHDPQFYPFVQLSVAELLRAWDASRIGYIDKTYTLRHHFREKQRVERAEMLDSMFAVAQELQSGSIDWPIAFSGRAAYDKVLTLLKATPSPAFAGLLSHFSLPIGSRRCVDAMRFMQEADRPELADMYEAKARLYGSAQYYASKAQWDNVIEIFEDFAELEAHLCAAIST